jgi:hypothetical protein
VDREAGGRRAAVGVDHRGLVGHLDAQVVERVLVQLHSVVDQHHEVGAQGSLTKVT